MNKVYIIVVNFNNYSDTIECIESVLKSDYQNYQIFIIDNSANDLPGKQLIDWASNKADKNIATAFQRLVNPPANKPLNFTAVAEDDFSILNKVFEEKLVILRGKNRGFAAANNIALKYILERGDSSSLIWILNNDTVVEKNTLGSLVDGYKKHGSEKYIFASKLRYYNSPNLIQAVAGRYNKWLGKHNHIGEGAPDNGQYNNYNFGELDYVVGASIFLPVLFVKQAGIMCEDYFLYFEELDWVMNGYKHGFKTILVPDAIVYHKEGSSIVEKNDTGKDTSLAEYYSITNRVRFIKKWFPLYLLTVLPGVAWALCKRILKGRFKLVKKIVASLFYILLSKNAGPLKYESR